MKKKLIRGKFEGLITIFRDAMYEDIYIKLDGGHIVIMNDGTIYKSRNLKNRKPLEKNKRID